MRGFQPQNFADGGLVRGVKRLFGMDEERNARVAAYRAQQAQEKAQQQPAPAPAPAPAPQQKAISGYNGMSALQRREKEQGLADGGRVRPRGFVAGPGTETSDSIPARLSDGEYVLPADTVRAVGVPALDQLKDATHTPVAARGFAPRVEPEQPQQFFANGGLVDDERKRAAAGASGLAVDTSPENAARFVQVPPPIGRQPQPSAPTAPTAPAATRGLPSAQRTPPISQIPTGGMTAPAAPPTAPAPAPSTASPSNLYMQDRAQELKSQIGQGNYAQAVGTGVRTAVQGLGMYGVELADKVATPVVDAARGLGRGLLGSDATTSATAPAAAPQPAATPNPTDKRLAAGTQAKPSVPDATATSGSVTRVGNSYSGNNISGDITVNGKAPGGGFMVAEAPRGPAATAGVVPGTGPAGARGFAVGATGDAMADRAYAESLGRLMASGQIAAPAAGPSLIMSGNTGFRRDRSIVAGELGAQRALDRAQGRDPASQRRAAELQRTQVEQQGANFRSARGFQVDSQRVGIEQQRANEESALRGFQTRAALQQEQLRGVLTNPNSTLEQRQQAQQALRAMSGKAEENRFTVVPGGQEWDSQAGAMRNVPARVLNNQTGQFVEQPAGGTGGVSSAPPSKESLVKGQVYQTARGPARWNGASFDPA